MSHHIEPRSVISYLSGICQQLEPYFPDVCTSCHTPLVERTMRGCLRLKSLATKRKRALTFGDLYRVLNHLATSLVHDNLLFQTMLVTGFFMLMRLGKLTFSNDINLRNWKKISKRSFVVLTEDQYEFDLPSHKADRFFEGNRIIVKSRQYCDINPVQLFSKYLIEMTGAGLLNRTRCVRYHFCKALMRDAHTAHGPFLRLHLYFTFLLSPLL
jgi:hypothetical protein